MMKPCNYYYLFSAFFSLATIKAKSIFMILVEQQQRHHWKFVLINCVYVSVCAYRTQIIQRWKWWIVPFSMGNSTRIRLLSSSSASQFQMTKVRRYLRLTARCALWFFTGNGITFGISDVWFKNQQQQQNSIAYCTHP